MIPKVIHKVIIVDTGKMPQLPEEMNKAIETWYRINPGYKVKIYSDESCENYIKQHFDEHVLKAYHTLKPYSYKCDLMRHLIMYNEGGWYTDARMICYKPLDELDILDKEFYVCVDTPQQQLCMTTGFIGSIPKHPISKKMIDIILWNIANKHYGMDCLAPTGPGAYINACIDHVRKFPHTCMIGKHVIDNGEQFIDFDLGRFAKVKYNNARGADNSDLAGTNDYGKMWRNWDVYRDV
jgi:mannosyltransferase OCH1-like enzyme